MRAVRATILAILMPNTIAPPKHVEKPLRGARKGRFFDKAWWPVAVVEGFKCTTVFVHS